MTGESVKKTKGTWRIHAYTSSTYFRRQIQLLCSWHTVMYHSFHLIRDLSGSHVQAEDIFSVSSIQDNHWILIWITIPWWKSESQGWRIEADVQANLCPEECVESIATITGSMTLEYSVDVINSLPRWYESVRYREIIDLRHLTTLTQLLQRQSFSGMSFIYESNVK